MLKKGNVVLRELRKGDDEIFLPWVNDPEITQYTILFPPITWLFEEKWVNDVALDRNRIVFVIEVGENGKNIPIGNCGFHGINWKEGDSEIGMMIGEKAYQSQGYGTKALKMMLEYGFNTLNLYRVSANAYAFNERSLRMQLKCGLKIEGISRQAIFKNGQYHDKVMLGILKEEWLRKNAGEIHINSHSFHRIGLKNLVRSWANLKK
jgi:RimJ/RimL family protein N-acetyltransferase